MFKKENERMSAATNNSSSDTIIAMGVKVEGDFVSEGNVIIEGEVLGSLKTAQDLQVGERARISADVVATNARVSGEIHGNVVVREKLELTATSHVAGDVYAKILIMNAGAQLNGRVMMGEEMPQPTEARTSRTSKADRTSAA